MDSEIWMPVPGYGDHYEVSSIGGVRVKPRVIVKPHPTTKKPRENHYPGRLLSIYTNSDGYLKVTLGVDGKTISKGVHILVALAFHGDRPRGYVICHNNGIKTDNRPENLRYDTQAANNRDRKRHGTLPVGEKHGMAKLRQEDVDQIRLRSLHYLDIQKEYGISRSQAYRIYKGQSWTGTARIYG